MLRSLPSSKIDWSSFALEHKSISSYLVADDIEARIRDRLQKSTQALDGSVVLALGATKTHGIVFSHFLGGTFFCLVRELVVSCY